MATYYVYNGGSGAGGTSWATAYTTLTAAFSGHAAGDTYYVAHDHNESTAAAITLTSLGTIVSPTKVICVNRAGSVPPVSADLRTTAQINTTGSNAHINIGAGVTYWYGIKFQVGSSTLAASFNALSTGDSNYPRFENCAITLNNSSASSRVTLASSSTSKGGLIHFLNCVFTFGSNSNQGFSSTGSLEAIIIGGSVVVGASIPLVLFNPPAETFRAIGVDFSAITATRTLIGAGTKYSTLLQDCKLASGVTVATTPTTLSQSVYLVRCDSGDTNYRQELYRYTGTLTTETTIVRTGGASDGTTPISWKIVTTANSEWVKPFECPPRVIWNDTTGSRTVTVYGIWGGGAVPLNDEIWFEVAYLGTSGFPIASIATTNKADILATGANTTADSSTWGGSTTDFKMQVTFTVNEKGPLMVIVKVAKLSSTFYIDPKIEVT